MDLYPLTFVPLFKARVWGGRRLASLYGKPLPPGVRVGESWEIADRPGDESVVANGPLAGKSLRWLMVHAPEALLGRARPLRGRFPLLVKLLDAHDRLSVQVHPPAPVAARLGGEPKTEMWFVTHAEPGAELFVGLRRGVSRERFVAALAAGKVAECLHRVEVREGDAMLVPSGRVHAIGAGSVLFEIQENADTTYRVFDWNRLGLDGRPRALHIAQSLASIDFDDHEPPLLRQEPGSAAAGRRLLAAAPSFRVEYWPFVAGVPQTLALEACVALLAVVRGALQVVAPHGEVTLSAGTCCLLPACCDPVRVVPRRDGAFLLARPAVESGSSEALP